MLRATQILRQSRNALVDLKLLKVLQSEIEYELASPPPSQDNGSGYVGDFVVDYDSSKSHDIFLRKNCKSGEEIAVSALMAMGPMSIVKDDSFTGNVLMKVCVKKPGLNSLLQFDCEVYVEDVDRSDFDIHNVRYFQSTTAFRRPSAYTGPEFSNLDSRLQDALKQYLEAKGVNEGLTNFLLRHLNQKEQNQYVNWLQKLESLVKN